MKKKMIVVLALLSFSAIAQAGGIHCKEDQPQDDKCTPRSLQLSGGVQCQMTNTCGVEGQT